MSSLPSPLKSPVVVVAVPRFATKKVIGADAVPAAPAAFFALTVRVCGPSPSFLVSNGAE